MNDINLDHKDPQVTSILEKVSKFNASMIKQFRIGVESMSASNEDAIIDNTDVKTVVDMVIKLTIPQLLELSKRMCEMFGIDHSSIRPAGAAAGADDDLGVSAKPKVAEKFRIVLVSISAPITVAKALKNAFGISIMEASNMIKTSPKDSSDSPIIKTGLSKEEAEKIVNDINGQEGCNNTATMQVEDA